MAGRANADEVLAAAIAGGATVRDAAATAGVAERTAFRRLAEAGFKARVAELQARMVAEAAGRLAGAMTAAADVLKALLADPDPRVRLAAATRLIDAGVRVRQAVELEASVEDMAGRLEAVVNQAADSV